MLTRKKAALEKFSCLDNNNKSYHTGGTDGCASRTKAIRHYEMHNSLRPFFRRLGFAMAGKIRYLDKSLWPISAIVKLGSSQITLTWTDVTTTFVAGPVRRCYLSRTLSVVTFHLAIVKWTNTHHFVWCRARGIVNKSWTARKSIGFTR